MRALIVLAVLAVLAACGPGRAVPTPARARPAPAVTAEPQELVFPDDPFRATQPTAGPPRPFGLPKVQAFTLASGLRVYLVEQHDLPLVAIDLRFSGGVALSPRAKAGLANVCIAMLTEGTAKLDKLQYAAALATRASTIKTYVTDDTMGLTVRALTRHLPATFAQLAETIVAPAFRAADFERLVKAQIEIVRQWRASPPYLHWRVHAPVFYGASHPFGAVTTEASLARITVADCKQFVASHLRPAGSELFVVGDLTEAQIRSLFDHQLAGWQGAPRARAALPAPRPLQGRVFFVHLPGAAQSFVSVMQHVPSRTAGDHVARTIAERVYGGGMASRVNMNLREDKAYSYGASSDLRYTRHHGMLETISAVRTDATYQAVLELHRELDEVSSDRRPITSAELHSEQQAAILGLPGRFGTADDALVQYRELVYLGLPVDHYETYSAQLRDLTLDRVHAAARQYLSPATAVYLIAGDGDAPLIARTGKGKDEPYLRDGKPVTLRAALVELARRGSLGKGGFVELDGDGRPIR